jgi:hypothetical protein
MQTGRMTDKERLAKFITDAKFDENKLLLILNKFKLTAAYNKFKKNK